MRTALRPKWRPEQATNKIEVARLRIHDIKDGLIEGSRDRGQTWETLGAFCNLP
jgi:hypothetical protein